MNFLRVTQRFVIVSALGLWLGGFTVYTAFVIRIGHRQIPGGRFGFVTAEVTSVLDVLALVAAVAAAWNLATSWGGLSCRLKWVSATSWVVLAAALGGAFLLHARLDRVLDTTARQISNRTRFESLHETYELVASILWAMGLVQLWVALAGWSRRDASSPP